MKKALCVGCNYPSKAFGLNGAVNDAFLIADALQKQHGFELDNVCLLHDVYPGQKKTMKVDQTKMPTRKNILAALDWLVRSAKNGDVIFFSFSGYGLQVDDMNGYHDEGYDEAILPTDFVDGREGDYSVIVTDDIHDILMSVPSSCTVVVLMDSDHASSILDVSGTLDGELMNGLKYQNFCGLKVHTGKMTLANHDREVWQEERARAIKARPRFQPMAEIDNPRKGRLPARHAMSRVAPLAFAYAAAGNSQTCMELQVGNTVVDGKDVPKVHGVLTYCFVKALEELGWHCTHADLVNCIKRQMAQIKERDLPKMDQELQFTFSKPNSNPGSMRIFNGVDLQSSRMSLGAENMPMPQPAAQVVPPPAVGVIPSHVPPPVVAAAPVAADAGTGTTGHSGRREREVPASTGESWPALPPPPPPPVPRRTPSEAHSEGGSHSSGQQPSDRPREPQRDPWNDLGHGSDTRTGNLPRPPPTNGQMPRPPPPANRGSPPPSGPLPQNGGGIGRQPSMQPPPQQSPQTQGPEQPWMGTPIKGLTPPNLFNAPTPLSFGHSPANSFGHSFGQLHPPGAGGLPGQSFAQLHGQPRIPQPGAPPGAGYPGGLWR